MKRGIVPLLLGILCICTVLFCCACSSSENPEAGTDAEIPEKITIQYEVCDSGGGRIEGWRTQHGKPGETTGREVTAVPKLGYTFAGWSDGVTEPSRTDVYGTEDRTVTANFRIDRAELPVMVITTDTGSDVPSKTSYIGASISLSNTGNAEWEFSAARAEIRGRGNATWNFEKKSYRFRLEKKRQLLGLGSGEEKTWILMANQCDQSLLRNYLSIYMANHLSGIGFNSSGTFVEVYLNGNYRGVYLLAEQVETADNRINLGRDALDDPETADAGFLVELDMYAEDPKRFYAGNRPYELKSDILSRAQFDFAQNYIDTVDSVLKTGDKAQIEKYLDLDSALDGYLLEEFFKNIDVGWSSFYMYKLPGEHEVLHLGPFWDFDLAAGNDYRLDNGSWKGLYAGADYGFDQSNRWFIRLMRYDWFRAMVKERWAEISDVVDDVIEEARRVSASAPKAFDRNFEAWPIFGKRINQEPEHVMALSSHREHADYLIHWLTERKAWLDQTFAELD